MNVQCPSKTCPSSKITEGTQSRVAQNGYFRSHYRSRPIRRYRCVTCGRHFSNATFNPCYRQKKRHLNDSIKFLLCSLVSQRRIAWFFGINRKTVARKFLFLAREARIEAAMFRLLAFAKQKAKIVYFDEMQSFEHTNAKPLSIALMVDEYRRILGFEISKFPPPTARLRKICQRKYSPWPDETFKGLDRLLSKVKVAIDPKADLRSDQKRMYASLTKKYFPNGLHKRFKSRKAAVVGQGELKEKANDPLFSLNHTCAMLRANINRLARQTWCTTKKLSALEDHIYIYMSFHNNVLLNRN